MQKLHLMPIAAALTALLASCGSQTAAPKPTTLAKPETRQVAFVNEEGEKQVVTGFVRDGKVLLEEDIILVDDLSKLSGQGTYTTYAGARWTNRTIPYAFASNVPQTIRDRVLQAANAINSSTNVILKPRQYETNYVQITYNTGTECSSSLGMMGGTQTLTLADRCEVGSIVHEFGHAMGLYHEQTRPDRDQYVSIQWGNIPYDWQSQYQVRSGSAGYGAYDFDSLMHYPATFDGKIAIKPLDPTVDINRMGQRVSLSPIDISTINMMYPKTTTTTPTSPTPITSGTSTYTGSLSAGDAAYQTSSTGFSYNGGTLKATLSAPTGTDFDLYIQKLNNGAWSTVATSAKMSTSSESVSYAAASGTYRVKITSYQGSGNYSLTLTR